MNAIHPHTQMKLEKVVRQAIEREWAKHSKAFSILAITFEGQADQTHESTAAVEIYNKNPQNPTVIRVPLRDLGPDNQKWSSILAQKGVAAVKMMRVRDGISGSRRFKTLDDMA